MEKTVRLRGVKEISTDSNGEVTLTYESTFVDDSLTLIANLSAEVARLTKRVESQEARVEALEEGGGKRSRYGLDELLAKYPTSKPTRKEIVEQAKRDIEALKRNGRYDISDPDSYIPFRCNVEFIVNREKRTVVALLRGYESGNVYAKGIAKAAPDDCFNEHIGKAIALRRALGVEVPQEYTNAPQPDEGVEVGDVVRVGDKAYQTARGRVCSVVGVEDDGFLVDAYNLGRDDRLTWVQTSDITVIDDSDREVYAND